MYSSPHRYLVVAQTKLLNAKYLTKCAIQRFILLQKRSLLEACTLLLKEAIFHQLLPFLWAVCIKWSVNGLWAVHGLTALG